MTNIDFNQKVYRFHEFEGEVWIEENTLAEVVSESAEETTSPVGVQSKLHIEERDGEWQLRSWGPYGHGNELVEVCESDEEANQRWLEITYECDYIDSEESYKWFDTEEEAIEDYVERRNDSCDDDVNPVTIESVKAELERCDAEHAEKVERIKKEDIATYRHGIEQYKKFGTVSKKLKNICNTILYDSLRSNPWRGERRTEVCHDLGFKAEVGKFYNETICKKL